MLEAVLTLLMTVQPNDKMINIVLYFHTVPKKIQKKLTTVTYTVELR